MSDRVECGLGQGYLVEEKPETPLPAGPRYADLQYCKREMKHPLRNGIQVTVTLHPELILRMWAMPADQRPIDAITRAFEQIIRNAMDNVDKEQNE